jgi:hypothetical protein
MSVSVSEWVIGSVSASARPPQANTRTSPRAWRLRATEDRGSESPPPRSSARVIVSQRHTYSHTHRHRHRHRHSHIQRHTHSQRQSQTNPSFLTSGNITSEHTSSSSSSLTPPPSSSSSSSWGCRDHALFAADCTHRINRPTTQKKKKKKKKKSAYYIYH